MALNGVKDQKLTVAGHSGVAHKSLLQSDALYQYIMETSVYPREPAAMKELREITANHPWSIMATPAVEGQFLSMLLKLINAKNTMEIGVFTGYSLLTTALAIPDDGKILAVDLSREYYNLGLPIIEKAGVAHKIDFREGLAMPLLDQMTRDVKSLTILIECLGQIGNAAEQYRGSFDFIFVDADKENYINYHRRVIECVKIGGVIGYDNTLLYGSVVAPQDAPLDEFIMRNKDFILEFNKVIAADPRIEICMVPIGDGITICRRLN